MLPQQYCLRWKYHHSNLQTMFSQLLDRGCFCDVTLACEGQLIRAHRVVLCACSTFFDTVLTNYASERDPIIIMKDATFADVKCLIEFMYKGEINVEHAHLASLLKTADDLKIKGLAEVSWRDEDEMRDQPPPPTPAMEFQSPTPPATATITTAGVSASSNSFYGHRSSSPLGGERERERRSPVSPAHAQLTHLPALTPMPSNSAASAVGAVMAEHYLGPKRKRGRPPLDDAYDVFNIRKLAQYAAHMDHQAYLEARHYADDQQRHQQLAAVAAAAVSPTTAAAAAAAAAYQQHIQQQQQQQSKSRQHQKRTYSEDSMEHQQHHEDPAVLNAEAEWINSNLEVQVSEGHDHHRGRDRAEEDEVERDISITRVVDKKKRHAHHGNGASKARKAELAKAADETNDLEKQQQQQEEQEQPLDVTITSVTEKREVQTPEEEQQQQHETQQHESEDSRTQVPQTVEEIERVEQMLHTKLESPTPTNSTSTSSSASSSSASSGSSRANSARSSSSPNSSSLAAPPPPPPPPPHAAYFGKYSPEGYLLNEHGMLMTHDAFVHAANAGAITTTAHSTASGSNSVSTSANGHHPHQHHAHHHALHAQHGLHHSATVSSASGDHEFVDIKIEDFDAADMRLTTEEMSQWKDVIKMDDYLAKGRRPQFWEEPFTRRVLDAIKNKRLEMKKAARILGVSYGTLYGRYREVYGCLKHPYGNATGSFRSTQPSDLSVQSRLGFDWLPPPKRELGAPLLPGQLEVGKIRPKDLSELWARPQI